MVLSNESKLVLLRVQLFTAMQQLEGEELKQFWELMDYVEACRPLTVTKPVLTIRDVMDDRNLLTVGSPDEDQILFIRVDGGRFSSIKAALAYFQEPEHIAGQRIQKIIEDLVLPFR